MVTGRLGEVHACANGAIPLASGKARSPASKEAVVSRPAVLAYVLQDRYTHSVLVQPNQRSSSVKQKAVTGKVVGPATEAEAVPTSVDKDACRSEPRPWFLEPEFLSTKPRRQTDKSFCHSSVTPLLDSRSPVSNSRLIPAFDGRSQNDSTFHIE